MANSEGPYSTLEDLEKDPTKRDIVVRLIRKWEARNRRRGSRLLSEELLFLDETGRLIKASINHRLIKYYKNIFKEGSIYHISSKKKIMARIVLKDTGTKVRLSIWDNIALIFFIVPFHDAEEAMFCRHNNRDLYLNTSPTTWFYQYDDPEELESSVSVESKDTCNNSDQKGKKLKLDDDFIAIEGTKRRRSTNRRTHQ
ncbi:unnamed protein product [Arabis nemorensis]|uniref:Replication protein A 70 kDa DNA-binding subunit B/D first OB fold domain-containing protein n=1 Tax=Arabis nemorensis TaxID=586526 RepID=A0A565BY64_9BRAS|nr:unnamed protein product [Arabis nemorensis]